MKADGSGLYQASNLSGYDNTPYWSPDGSQIAFISEHTGDLEIFVMNADGTDKRKLTRNRRYQDSSPAWSPDGSQLVFESDSQIYALDMGRRIAVRLTRKEMSHVYSISWSSLGKQIAFGAWDNIYVMNADGSNTPRNLTYTTDDDFGPLWQPCAVGE